MSPEHLLIVTTVDMARTVSRISVLLAHRRPDVTQFCATADPGGRAGQVSISFRSEIEESVQLFQRQLNRIVGVVEVERVTRAPKDAPYLHGAHCAHHR